MTAQDERQRLRTLIRQRRMALTKSTQHHAANQLLQRLITYSPLQGARSVALFISRDGEIDTSPLINYLWQQNKHVYLPLIHPFCPGHLLFQRYSVETVLKPDRLTIPAPELDVRSVIPLSLLDMIMVPLVAFDHKGQRLGMGGGYYDRTLAQRSACAIRVVGLAHSCQQIDSIPAQSWDIPLPVIITPDKIWCWPEDRYTHSSLTLG